ncbi:MAG: DUF6130 family protein [Vicinamibacterales bacterium]|jgi:hypothetical protein|nr:hypothetical protein [Acidobacteriota bacterium]MDP7211182.1 DUF6130 family protein [Vicinamibacterales bacterium]HJO16746.1 DUF6130 family protein [Vicinamibacterales bacterium]
MHRNEYTEVLCSSTRFVLVMLIAGGAITTTACGGGEETAQEPDTVVEEPAVEESPMDTSPRVSFLAPEEGATVSSPVHLMFGAENFVIEPVTDPPTIRQGFGHHHIGIDTDCLPAGEVIPQADPWVHFGTGSFMIDMQFEPGPHRVCLQIGDGEHRTIEGLNAMVSFTVE